MSYILTLWGRRLNVDLFDEVYIQEADPNEFEDATHVVGANYLDKNLRPVALYAGSEEACEEYMERFDRTFKVYNLHK